MSRPLPASAPPKADILRGWIKTTKDAILVFEATRAGIVPRVTRRFHDLEKRSIIQSGAILVFTEEESGIKRWTDPYLWSASRMQGNFLVRHSMGFHASTPNLTAIALVDVPRARGRVRARGGLAVPVLRRRIPT